MVVVAVAMAVAMVGVAAAAAAAAAAATAVPLSSKPADVCASDHHTLPRQLSANAAPHNKDTHVKEIGTALDFSGLSGRAYCRIRSIPDTSTSAWITTAFLCLFAQSICENACFFSEASTSLDLIGWWQWIREKERQSSHSKVLPPRLP